jgi:hypothetical protein
MRPARIGERRAEVHRLGESQIAKILSRSKRRSTSPEENQRAFPRARLFEASNFVQFVRPRRGRYMGAEAG